MKNIRQRALPRIGVLLWLNQEHGRRIFVGVEEYAERHRSFDVQLIAKDGQDRDQLTATINGLDGLVSSLEHLEFFVYRKRIRVPVVEAPLLPVIHPGIVSVGCDYRRIGPLAVEHFKSLRVPNLVLLYHQPNDEVQALAQAFRSAAAAAGCSVIAIPYTGDAIENLTPLLTGDAAPIRLPAGVLCARDRTGRQLALAAQQCGVRCPGDLAILGIGNDPISCMASLPTLSSVVLPTQEIGQTAAGLLERVLAGGQAKSIWLPPAGIVSRGSTRMLFTSDPLVEAAALFIRANFHLPIGVRQVAQHVGLSRSALESRYQKAVGITVHASLVENRLQHATALLARTRTPIKQIAYEVGRMNPQNFSRFIHHCTGHSPVQYRQRHRRPAT